MARWQIKSEQWGDRHSINLILDTDHKRFLRVIDVPEDIAGKIQLAFDDIQREAGQWAEEEDEY